MSKSRRKHRRSHRSKQKQQERMILYGGMGLVVLIVLGIIGYSIWNRAPEVDENRLNLDPVIGPADAEVTIVEYGSYTCHACRVNHQNGVVDYIVENFVNREPYAGHVKFVFVNYPVIAPIGINELSAKAAQCALDQGNEAFWEFHDALFGLSDEQMVRYTEHNDYVELANQIGLDGEKIGQCLDDNTHQRTIEHHSSRAEDDFVRGTPAFYVNGQLINVQDLENAINRELGLG